MFIWSLNWYNDAFSVSCLEINGKLLTFLKLGKIISMSSLFRRDFSRAFSTHQESIEGICFLNVLIWEEENKGIPRRAALELELVH